MKHPLSTTIVLLILFLATQIIGLVLIAKAIHVDVSETGEITVAAPETALGPPPETNPWQTLLMIVIGVTIGTGLILVLAKLRKFHLWRIWFLLAAWLTMTISFGVIVGERGYTIAAIVGLALAVWKTFRPNPVVHNLTELFIYPGIAILFYHILNLPVMIILMLLISAYDVVAVIHSKHMVSMALFQAQSKVFAGLAVPRSLGPKKAATHPIAAGKHVKHASTSKAAIKKEVDQHTAAAKEIHEKQRSAILGGGDIAFPLLFAAVVLEGLIAAGTAKAAAIGMTSIISVCAMLGLAALFWMAKKDKFYPAMPAVTLGCLIGWGITLLL